MNLNPDVIANKINGFEAMMYIGTLSLILTLLVSPVLILFMKKVLNISTQDITKTRLCNAVVVFFHFNSFILFSINLISLFNLAPTLVIKS